jgi:hypothetical protein
MKKLWLNSIISGLSERSTYVLSKYIENGDQLHIQFAHYICKWTDGLGQDWKLLFEKDVWLFSMLIVIRGLNHNETYTSPLLKPKFSKCNKSLFRWRVRFYTEFFAHILVGLGWVGLGWVGLCCVVLCCVVLRWFGLCSSLLLCIYS